MKGILVLITISLLGLKPAFAIPIVDTGANPLGQGYVLSESQWLATEFIVSDTSLITDIEGFISYDYRYDNIISLTLYSDGGEIPGAELFTTQATLTGGFGRRWQGVTALSWLVDPGAYWISFEVRDQDIINGRISASMSSSAINPLDNAAYFNFNNSTTWAEKDDLNLGVRINAIPVPEPSTLLLVILGLFSITLTKRLRD